MREISRDPLMRSRFPGRSGLLLGALVLVACGGPVAPEALEPTARQAEALTDENGINLNGLVTNGLVTNGLVTNGLVTNGLDPAALGTGDFAAWFNTDPVLGDMVMRYVVKCAVPAGESRAWTNPATNTGYVWPGALGLTPDWANGNAISEPEEQLITACLAAHVNKYGRHTTVSLKGRTAHGEPIAVSLSELVGYDVREGCFFGNLFRGEGVYVGFAGTTLGPASSSIRACAMNQQSPGTSQECAPMVNVGTCALSCLPGLDLLSYGSCAHDGKMYRPLTTSIRPVDIYRCGDGVCQFTESCGSGNTASSCHADCGDCR